MADARLGRPDGVLLEGVGTAAGPTVGAGLIITIENYLAATSGFRV